MQALREPPPTSARRVEEVLDYLTRLDARRPEPSDLGEEPPGRAWRQATFATRRQVRRVRVGLAFLAGLILLAGGRQLSDSGRSLGASTASPYMLKGRDEHTSLVAQARSPRVPVLATPANGADVVETLEHPTASGAPLVFLVIDDSNADWLRVHLPIGPSGTTGWVRRDDVGVRATRYRVQVLLRAHRLELYDGAELTFHTRVAVGTQDTPPPGSRLFIEELIELSTADTVYGSHVFGFSGSSSLPESLNGREGVVGIHGTNDPSVIGRDVNIGCIRVTNEAMEELVGRLPLGTPVDIVA